MKLIPSEPRHIDNEGCCAVRGCWSTATEERERYAGAVVIHYCPGHAETAARVFGPTETEMEAA